jgi:sulfide:quinone oxidoreductase
VAPLNVLIAGGGVAGMEAALALRILAGDRVRTELIAPVPDFVNRPASVTTPFAAVNTPRLPLDRLTDLGITVRRGALAAVDVGRHQARTNDGDLLRYDRLIVAIGARPITSIEGATHFRGPRDAGALERIVRTLARSPARSVTFALAPSATWPLPFYELVLLTAGALGHHGKRSGAIRVVTHEENPLELFGPLASEAVGELFDRDDVELTTTAVPKGTFDGALLLDSGELLPAGDVVAMPALEGRRLTGLEHDAHGFVRVDRHGRVRGAGDVFAAGDVTAGPVKQGGLAAQQADAAAMCIAREAGASVPVTPAEPVLRAVLTTADGPLHLRTGLGDPEHGQVSCSPLWRPAGKLAARWLAGYLANGNPEDELVDLHPAATPPR